MSQAATPDGVVLEYETFGPSSGSPLLLIAGFGAQLIAWCDGFCELLANAGRYVIRFDNRDCGLSSRFEAADVELEPVIEAVMRRDFGLARSLVPYDLSDMAKDGLGLMTALGLESAHIVGASMGGMIAQTLAIEHPERVLSLTSMMASTGEPDFGQSTPEAMEVVLMSPPSDRHGYIEFSEKSLVWASKRYGDPNELRDLAARSYDRGYYPAGGRRQLAALLASGTTVDGLRGLRRPTLVIHGRDDTLITRSGGERTAAVTPGAQLLLVEDMGHDRPRPLWPLLTDAIVEFTER